MRFLVIVNAHPNTAVAKSALTFCQELISQRHSLQRIFFYGSGVLNGLATSSIPLNTQWSEFIVQNGLDAVCCAGSAQAHQLEGQKNLLEGFAIAGLTQLIDGMVYSERTITFGHRIPAT